MKKANERGYTLIELSIVIVIIGLLIAGVAAGLNLVKQANLRAIVSEMQGYVTSCNSFSLKYNKLPGDIDNAYSFWGTACAGNSAYCNGNNDGIITKQFSSPVTDEINKVWVHLYNAGMITTVIQPIVGTGSTLNSSVPQSRVNGAGYVIIGGVDAAPFSSITNAVFIGRQAVSDTLIAGALYPADAFAIDQKVDDGGFDNPISQNPIGAITGAWRALDGSGSTTGSCISNTASGIYNISNSTLSCRLGFALTTA